MEGKVAVKGTGCGIDEEVYGANAGGRVEVVVLLVSHCCLRAGSPSRTLPV